MWIFGVLKLFTYKERTIRRLNLNSGILSPIFVVSKAIPLVYVLQIALCAFFLHSKVQKT